MEQHCRVSLTDGTIIQCHDSLNQPQKVTGGSCGMEGYQEVNSKKTGDEPKISWKLTSLIS